MTAPTKADQIRVIDPAPEGLAERLNRQFPAAVSQDSYGAFVINPDQLIDVVTFLKDSEDLKYNYLANLTCTDYPDHFEIVSHLCSIDYGGGPLAIKVYADKNEPVVPSLVPVFAGADFQEREVYDLFGVRFAGHPNLKRILLWEGFHGHPLRKDWKEAYYEEDHKPFASRWPGGHHVRAEEQNPWGRNVSYPPGWDPASLKSDGDGIPVIEAEQLKLGGIKTDKLIVNMGPQHPSTHGVFQMRVTLDGETVVDLEPVMGYMHRNHDKIGERNLWLGNMPFTDRLDYIANLSMELGYAITVEKLMGLEVPERAEYIRVIMNELTRVQSHLWSIGFLLNDLGAFFTPSLYAIEERELILDLFEMTTGSRLMCNYMRFGGVAYDLPEEFLPIARELVYNRLPRAIDQMDRYLTENEIVLTRTKGIGVLPRDMAINYSTSGHMLRASGVQYDIRRAQPYSIYDRFDFEIPVYYGCDAYDRYRVRLFELRQSVRILQQALAQLPEGPILAGKKAWQIRVPKGEVYGRTEAPRGEIGYFCVSDGGANPYRYHVRSGCFVNLTPLGEMCKGYKVADVIAILGSIDIVLGEVDR